LDVIAIHAATRPGEAALVMDDRTITWSELFAWRNRLANALVGLGVTAGEHVVIYSLNSIESLVASAAARAVGTIPVPMNHRLTAEEVAYILDDSDAVAVFAGDAFLPILDAVRAGATKVRHWILMERERRPWAVPLDDLAANASAEPVASGPDQGLGGSMLYTAGTTGRPKGALRTTLDPARVVEGLQALDLATEHVHLVAGPLYHSAPGAFAMYTSLFGGTVVIMRKFDAEEALRLIERHHCTSTFMAPTLLKRIVDLPADVRARRDVSSMRAIIMAAAPCPMTVKEGVVALFGPVLYEFYGSTELGMNTILRPEDVLRKPGSCGTAAPGMELAILDDDGRPVPQGAPGTLYVRRNPAMFDAYYKKPDATRETARGEWLTVGDVAWMDAEGFVYICDRKRDMIISGGVNIYPAEIEDALHRHPQIEDVAVFGVPDDDWGERVHAAVQVRRGGRLTQEDVVAFARERVADYKVPREVSFHEALPRDSAGKLVKRALRDPYWAGRAAKV
jgi:fatty-acyl-CoA synthase/long-chain acyl-CoA synthetase